MEGKNSSFKFLDSLCSLPERVLRLREFENVPEFVVYELCNGCFDIKRAAFFVDNPDFDCLKGVAGFAKEQSYNAAEEIWDNPHKFSQYMKLAPFNQKVRSFTHPSVKKQSRSDQEIVKEIAKTMGLDEHSFISWDMKHDNHGIFVYNTDSINPEHLGYVKKGLAILSFCPIY